MEHQKPSFRANKKEPMELNIPDNQTAAPAPEPKKLPPRKELAAIWLKETTTGETYLNGKVTLPDGKELWFRAFKNKNKKETDTTRPEYVAWQDK